MKECERVTDLGSFESIQANNSRVILSDLTLLVLSTRDKILFEEDVQWSGSLIQKEMRV